MEKPTRRQFIQTGTLALGAGLILPVVNRTRWEQRLSSSGRRISPETGTFW
jgi:hypothetical protein